MCADWNKQLLKTLSAGWERYSSTISCLSWLACSTDMLNMICVVQKVLLCSTLFLPVQGLKRRTFGQLAVQMERLAECENFECENRTCQQNVKSDTTPEHEYRNRSVGIFASRIAR